MSNYERRICEQLTEFETPPEVVGMSIVELAVYIEKMDALSYKVNVYGPKRCNLFRSFVRNAKTELGTRISDV